MRAEQSAEAPALTLKDPEARVFELPARVLGAPQDLAVGVSARTACAGVRAAQAEGYKTRYSTSLHRACPPRARVIRRKPTA